MGEGECPGHSEGWTAPFSPPSLCWECLRHCTSPGKEREAGTGLELGYGPWILPDRGGSFQTAVEQTLRLREGGGGFLALPVIRLGPSQAAHLLIRLVFTELLCGKLGSAIFFLLPGWASPGAQRSDWH